jgi:hypothetical protein
MFLSEETDDQTSAVAGVREAAAGGQALPG